MNRKKRLTPDEKEAFYDDLHQKLADRQISLPEVLHTLRVDFLGVDQATFARIGKVSVRTLRELEAGRGNPSLKTLDGLLKHFGLGMVVAQKKN